MKLANLPRPPRAAFSFYISAFVVSQPSGRCNHRKSSKWPQAFGNV